MLLSHSKKFIFVHIYKTGGTSTRKVLEPYDYSYNVFHKVKSVFKKGHAVKPKLCHKHAKALEIKEAVGPEVFNRYFKFAFVRNPWDWQVSLYHYALKDQTNKHHKIISGFKTFEEYISWRTTEEKVLQREFIYDGQDNCMVDFIGKFENLSADFSEICDKIGIGSIDLPHLNKTKRKDFKDYYNDKTQRMVAEAYADDIKTFGYSFF
ncbi:MAG: sulfotransferase family protein [Saprospiraceae bacterium]|nr:sulfotransferase family protein [Saprospiraceae bacterium]